MAEVRFPGGYSFNPETGEISGNGIPRSTRSGGSSRPSTRTNSSSRPTYNSHRNSSLSLWDRVDNFIIGIGNWIAGNGETAMSYIAMGCLGLAWLGFAIGIILVWVDEGFIWAVVSGIIGGGIMYFISGIALAVFYFIDDFILLIIRYIFYNVWTFLLALAILCGSIFLNNADNLISNLIDSTVVEEAYDPVIETNLYYCTAYSSLNVRKEPRKNASVVGTLSPGQEVHVYNFVDGFAKISYNGTIAYASSAYLKKK